MNKEKLFAYLSKKKAIELIELLEECYCCMSSEDIRGVFGVFEDKFLSETPCDGRQTLSSVHKFVEDSLNGHYYAPFNVDSKNYMHIPEEHQCGLKNSANY